MRKLCTALSVLGMTLLARAQGVSSSFQQATSDVAAIAGQIAGVVLAVVGLVGIGRAAYKFAHGDHDAVTSLVMGIVALALGALAATFTG